jgi:phenylalanyl-tRNA synthetase beta chain
MKIPVAWLREYVDVPEGEDGIRAFADRLTMAGLEVEEILETAAGPTLYTKITPNRGDWASVYGTAREAAAAIDRPLKPMPAAPASIDAAASAAAERFASVEVRDLDACPRYAAKIVRNVSVGPSPRWMQERLEAAGMRPVNNVVDVTNYVMLELGQPLHAFDLDTLPEGKIVVRQADPGETLTTLDGVERKLGPARSASATATSRSPIAGVMGGGPTEVTEATRNLLLESAHFDPLSIRRTAKRLPLRDRGELPVRAVRGPRLVPVAAERAAQLLAEIAGGEAVPGMIDVAGEPTPPRRILARVDRIRRLLGADLDRTG